MTAAVSERYKAAFRNHPAGVAIITAGGGDRPVGLTATSVMSVSAEPALLAFSLSADSSAAPSISRAGTVVVHLLAARQVHLARRFATGGIDRFADRGGWRYLPTGEPLLSGTDIWMRGRIVERVGAGDATVVIIEVLEAEPGIDPGPRLVYQNRNWYRIDESAVVA